MLSSARQRVVKAWMSLQVEYQGSYSDQRLQQLGHYMKELSTLRLLLVCVLTPLPCLFLSLIKEVPPMAPPEAGVYGNGVFFARSWAVMADPSLFVEVQRQLVVYQCQTTLPFVYPLYIYGFVSLTGWNQVIFVAVLPIIQIIAKNWISRALGDDDDQKPQCVIFVVEVYNALYVSNVLQTASSWASTAAVMVVDLVQFWVSMLDIVEIFKDVNALMAKIPRDHPLATESFVQVAAHLMTAEAQAKAQSGQVEVNDPCLALTTPAPKPTEAPESGSYVPKMKDAYMSRQWIVSQTARVFPFHPQNRYRKQPTISDNDLKLDDILTPTERSMFIRKTKHVLFIAEYLVLVEYVEAVLPFVYCLHELILFQMHNSAYYPSLAGLSSAQVSSGLRSTLLYSVLQLGSFITLMLLLKIKLGYSPLQHLAFVLDVHAGVVQTKLNLIFVYIMQVSLTHLGADFSFKFSWLHPRKD
ncbi:hypothetical protein PHYSODRAFT_519222 [Phytophthora sojae]|uniref:Transmembrane protein n=1 Tax=Phytophthora sojae (strain P6497) TaxID=1094619 RepID=G5A140_PHYSP|nr:hypothetical protein PHYSODRAFT_519222 [Phytophthora sojae]EGZ10642.1 hypothetical protein PHYSODRAFT_519222 [Phytophthora sojae]|eukprot:XP_009533387.1 hypothetical protein PHYSODRAFT_519222 [Phytophthora sojae]